MVITDRQKDILKAIVRSYSKSTQPVGSQALYKEFNFGIGPAMIRQDMAALEKEGFIHQPHTSAGRVPTDKAYRLYISELEKKETNLSAHEQRKISAELGSAHKAPHELLRELAHVIAELSGEFSVSGLEGKDVHYTHGFARLVRNPQLHNVEQVKNLMQFMDEMDGYFDRLLQGSLNSSLRVFIGKENPVKEFRSFSMVTGRYKLPHGQAGFVSIIGPKHMNYQKNVALIRYVRGVLNNG